MKNNILITIILFSISCLSAQVNLSNLSNDQLDKIRLQAEQSEIKEANSRQNEAQFFSGRFAAKEAIKKATSTHENSSKLTFKSIEIFNYDSGKPGVHLKNDSVVDISISHDGNYAVAFCVVQ